MVTRVAHKGPTSEKGDTTCWWNLVIGCSSLSSRILCNTSNAFFFFFTLCAYMDMNPLSDCISQCHKMFYHLEFRIGIFLPSLSSFLLFLLLGISYSGNGNLFSHSVFIFSCVSSYCTRTCFHTPHYWEFILILRWNKFKFPCSSWCCITLQLQFNEGWKFRKKVKPQHRSNNIM